MSSYGFGGANNANRVVRDATRELAERTAAASRRRQGAGRPDAVLDELSVALVRAVELDSQALPVDPRVRVNFLRQLLRGLHQWVELTRPMVGIDRSLDLIIERGRRQRHEAAVAANVQVHKMALRTIRPEDRLLLLEFDALTFDCDVATLLKRTGLGQEELPRARWRKVRNKADMLLAKLDALSDSPDPENLFAAVTGLLVRIYHRSDGGRSRRARRLLDAALARCKEQPVGNVHLGLLMLRLRECETVSEEIEFASRITLLLRDSPAPVFSPERAGYMTYIADEITHAIARLAFSDDPAAHRCAAGLARDMSNWFTIPSVEDRIPVAHILIADSHAIVLIEHADDVLVHVFPVAIEPLMALAGLSIHPPVDEIDQPRENRQRLSAELRSVLGVIAEYDTIRLNPLRFAAWIPWTALKFNQRTLAEGRDIAWMNPFPQLVAAPSNYTVDDEQPIGGTALVMDDSLGLHDGTVRAFKNAPNSVTVFSSDDRVSRLTPEVLQRACRGKAGLVFFCHASSDLHDYSLAGIPTGTESSRLTLREVAELDLRHVRWAAVIACESGRPNSFLPATSVAHALACAGVDVVVGTLWEIGARTTGPKFLKALRRELDRRPDDLAGGFRSIQRDDPTAMMAFSLIAR
ncbi:CHAT domain-containing protein [Nocardia sp. ET3-3]|uniref:CHAT domain-containing protein n=1 Tax=Nocardia terrae TaxID=2675851 RepID=A0A7K1V496_9NOCA|nr:CHAT domain-containing protein [Nocardia terrae]MVU81347.1 CHAT domain-containing protein [Nocardia terrae]